MLPRGALFLCLPLLAACDRNGGSPPVIVHSAPSVDSLIQSVLSSGEEFTDIEFKTVVESSTGRTIIPFDGSDPADAEVYDAINSALAETIGRFSRSDSPTNSERRINEVGSYFEEAIRHHINTLPGLSCDYPRTAEGKTQRSGYPDLRIVHEESGRVTYLDPKLVEKGAFDSSLRSFYFTPRNETNKVLDDAHHLVVGIEHDGNNGRWKFLDWRLVDLHDFKVRLKAEFQASNRDLYLPELRVVPGDSDGGASK